MKRRRLLSFALALVMCISMCMTGLTANAANPGDIPPMEPECTCEYKCTEGSIDPVCDVCSADGADLSKCTGTEVVSEPECDCTIKCTVDSINGDCSVCGVAETDLTQCKGSEQTQAPVLLGDPKAEIDSYDSLTQAIAEALNDQDTTIQLTGNITGFTQTIEIPANKIITLDLNGCTIACDPDEKISAITVKGTLTLVDTSDGGNGTITGGQGGGDDSEHNPHFGGSVYVSSDAIFNMKGGHISGNKSGGNYSKDLRGGCGVYVQWKGTFNLSGGYIENNTLNTNDSYPFGGAGVMVHGGTFNMTGGIIQENAIEKFSQSGSNMQTTGFGGGVFIMSVSPGGITYNATFNMSDGEIINNRVNNSTGAGAGVAVGCMYNKADSSTFTMTGGRISGNTIDAFGQDTCGGGVFCSGTMNISGSALISENTATATNTEGYGGGVYCTPFAFLNMSGGKITQNTATSKNWSTSGYGGGIYIKDDNSSSTGGAEQYAFFTMTDGEITKNSAGRSGGGVYFVSRAKGSSLFDEERKDFNFIISGGEITDNTAAKMAGGIYYDGDLFQRTGGKLCNNTAGNDGDDIIIDTNAYPYCIELGEVGDDWTLDCGHSVDGWYIDGDAIHGTSDDRWNATVTDGTNTFYCRPGSDTAHVEKIGTFSSYDTCAIKAAHGNLNYYTVTFDYNDNDMTPDSKETVLANTPVSLPQDPEREGYTFVDWNTNPDGTGTRYQSSDTITVTQNTTLYAQWTPNITIKPANMISYIGGDSYDGVVDETGSIVSSSGLPEPGFVLSFPGELSSIDVQNLQLQYAESNDTILKWEFIKYGEGEHNVYRIIPANGTPQRDVRIEFINAEGERVTSDSFNTKDYLNQSLTIEIYGEGIEAGKVFFAYQGKEYGITVQPATLTVRGTTSDVEYAKVLSDAESIDEGEPGLVANAGTTYTINDSDVHVDDASGISLLFDEIINDQGTDRTDLLKARTDRELGTNGNNRYYDFKYLDLVDQNNGNTWVKADQNITVYWPLPEGTNANTQFKLLHFAGAHRSLSNDQIQTAIQTGEVETMRIQQVTDTHVVFEVGSGGFSPFALVWETKSGGTVDPGPGPDPTPTEHTLRYDTNGGEKLQSETKKVSWTKEYEDLPIPERDGYTFAGWYRNSTLTMPITGDVKVYGTVTIYAKWNKTVTDPDETGVSDLLNTQEHRVYLHGYDTGLFGPNNDMTRAEAAQMFYNLLLDKDVPITVNFSDVPADAWYTTAVNTLASLGLVEGVGNNQFAPERAITRAEFTVIAMRFTNGEVSGENIFSDISANDWFYDQVVGSIQYGWITGYEDGTFRPNTTIARAEVTTIVNRMLGRSADVDYVDRHEDDLRLFPDVSQDYWAYYQIVEATNAHDYTKEGNTESWSKLK